MKTVAIIQARTGSTRLPNKVLLDLAGQTMLARVVERVRRAPHLDGVVVATTSLPGDDAIVELCERHGWACFRGSEEDVLDRYYRAASTSGADLVVRITADCPLIAPELIGEMIAAFGPTGADYMSNCLPPPIYPRGMDIELMTIAALARAWNEDSNPSWREHVTPFLYLNPAEFHVVRYASGPDNSRMRWTVDTAEDLAFVRRIYGVFGDTPFGYADILALLDRNPDWLEINRSVVQKPDPS